MDEQPPETEEQRDTSASLNQHLHPKVWIGALVVILLVGGYGAYAYVSQVWPFAGDLSIETEDREDSVHYASNVSIEKLEVDKLPIGYSSSRDFVLTAARLRSLQSALALYFNDHTSYPISLNELLTPDYIHDQTDLLLDAYSDEPFIYSNSGDNFEICGSVQQGSQLCIHKEVRYDSGVSGYAYLNGEPYSRDDDGFNVQIGFNNAYTAIRAVISDPDGSFSIELPPGIYTVSDTKGKLEVQTVVVKENQYTTITLTNKK